MTLSRTVFSRKSQIFTTQPAEGVPFGIGYRRNGSKTGMMGLPDGQKSLR